MSSQPPLMAFELAREIWGRQSQSYTEQEEDHRTEGQRVTEWAGLTSLSLSFLFLILACIEHRHATQNPIGSVCDATRFCLSVECSLIMHLPANMC